MAVILSKRMLPGSLGLRSFLSGLFPSPWLFSPPCVVCWIEMQGNGGEGPWQVVVPVASASLTIKLILPSWPGQRHKDCGSNDCNIFRGLHHSYLAHHRATPFLFVASHGLSCGHIQNCAWSRLRFLTKGARLLVTGVTTQVMVSKYHALGSGCEVTFAKSRYPRSRLQVHCPKSQRSDPCCQLPSLRCTVLAATYHMPPCVDATAVS